MIGKNKIISAVTAFAIGMMSVTALAVAMTSIGALAMDAGVSRVTRVLGGQTDIEQTVEMAETYSGTCSDDATWLLDMDTGVLTISGTGDMYDYDNPMYYTGADNYSPFINYSSYITSIVVNEGITSIGSYSFYTLMVFLEAIPITISLPNSVNSINEGAFCNDNWLSCYIYYYGTEDEWNNITIESNNGCLTSATIYYLGSSSTYPIIGECGDNLTWSLDDSGSLTIDGTGDMWDYSPHS